MAPQKARANTGRRAKNSNAIGGDELPWWRVVGETSRGPITMRFRAATRDEAMKQAHDMRVAVLTCEIMKPRCVGAAQG